MRERERERESITKVSRPLTFLQIFKYISLCDNTDKMILWYNEKYSVCSLCNRVNLFSPQNNSKYNHWKLNPCQQKWVNPLGKFVNNNIHHVNCQYFMWLTSLSRTVFTLLGMDFTRASQIATVMLFHSSMTTLRNWQIFENLCTSTFRLRIPQRCSIGFKSGDMLGQSITFTLSLFSKAMVVLEVCLGSFSCWNTALLPSFWREGIILCCSISQYMLDFMFPSMKYNAPKPAALSSVRPWHSQHHAWL